MKNFKKSTLIGIVCFLIMAISVPFFAASAMNREEEIDALSISVEEDSENLDGELLLPDDSEKEAIIITNEDENEEEEKVTVEIAPAEEAIVEEGVTEEIAPISDGATVVDENDPEYDPTTAYYYLYFNSCGGSYVSPQYIRYGNCGYRPANPVRSGYNFCGWYTTSSCYSSWNFSRPITCSTTAYAKWEKCSPSTQYYYVQFNSNGGTQLGSRWVQPNALITPFANPTRAGYTFAGWFRDSRLTSQWNFSTDRVNSNLTLYAKWTYCNPTTYYTVSFNSNGGSYVSSQTVQAGYTVSQPANPTRAGYTFAGWYKNSSCSTAWNFSYDKVNCNMTLYAKWNYCAPTTYLVSFATNGGTSIPSQNVQAGGYVNQPANPTRSGYTFAGWYKNSSCTTAWNFGYDRVYANTVIFAKWNYCAPTTYTVCFNSMGGSSVYSQSITSGSLVNQPSNPTRSGYTFAGWYKDYSCSSPWNFGYDRVYSNITLYAKWNYCQPTYYTVCFNSMGGSYVYSQTIAAGNLVSQPSNPTRSGYSFAGWYKNSSCSTMWNFGSDRVYSNITLYAKWTYCAPTTYTVCFNSNGGTSVPKQYIPAGGLVSQPANPTRRGYVFAGWYTDSGCRYYWNFGSYTVNSNTTLYAKWVRC